MKRTAAFLPWSLLLCALLVAGGQFFAHAEKPEAEESAAKSNVALVDISKIFKECEAFREDLAKLKIEVEAAKKSLGDERDKIKELADEFQSLDAGEPLKEKLEVEIAERGSRLQLKANLHKNEFKKREATIYAKTYRQIESTVERYSRRRGISLVLHNQKIEVDESDHSSVLGNLNKPIVYYDGIDITDEILKRLNNPGEKGDL